MKINTVKSCSRCLYPENHPLGIVIDSEGVCSGCRIHEEKDTLDWHLRWRMLQEIANQYKSKNPNNYDCIVPVTGGGDSYFIVHIVKEKLGLNPLLVTYNKYYNTPLGIRNLSNLRIKFDCDLLVQNVNPHAVKNITRTTLRELGSMYWHCLAGQTVFPVQTAVRYGVPLIIWGAHQGLEQVGMFSHEHEVEMTRRYRKDHDLMGYEADDLLSIFDTLNEDDIWQYRYPADYDLQRVGVKGIYLGNYVRWDQKAQHELMISKYNYKCAKLSRTFNNYEHIDCYNYMSIHDYIKEKKHGYGKVLDDACREIRYGRITRSQGSMLVDKFISQPIDHKVKKMFSEWLGIDWKSLEFLIENHAKKSCTKKQINESNSVKNFRYIKNSSLSMEKKPGYVTIGKGYP